MNRTLINALRNHIGQEVMLKGWLHNLRQLGKVNFLILRDRSGLGQIVVEAGSELDKIKHLQPGSVLTITGLVQVNQSAQGGAELTQPQIAVEVPITAPAPVDYTKPELNTDIDTELDYRSIVLRNEKTQAIFKVQAGIQAAFADSMRSQGFTEFRVPLIIGVPSESGAEVFEVKYFDHKGYLAQSPQIYKQIMVGVFERAFCISTVFRAERHNTSRHIMELTQMDGEMGFIESYEDALDVIEKTVRDMMAYLDEHHSADLEKFGATLPKLPEGKFPRIRVREALEIIEKRTGKSAEREELDVDPEDEREIGKWALEEHGSDFLFLLNFKKNKNFYTWNSAENPDESLSYDLECRGLEWLSGTHRIHEYDALLERLRNQGLSEEHYEHYLQAFKYGMPSEAGFSFGLERLTMQIMGLKNIREATLFPSDLKRIAAAKIKQKIYQGEEVGQRILQILEENNCEYQHLTHEPTPTSEDAARVRDIPLNVGIKALILKNKKNGENIMACVPADQKLDIKALGDKLGAKFEFEKPEVIKEKYGLEVGGIPPWGNLLGLKTYYSPNIAENEKAAFNNGAQTESVVMKSADLIKLVEPEWI